MKISLIIPAYNEELYIKECLLSVLKNAAGELHEIIVVDNASTDRTSAIVTELIKSNLEANSLIKIVREDNKGLTKARQRGLNESTGELLAYIDADSLLPAGWIDAVKKKFGDNQSVQNTASPIVCLSGPYRYHDGKKWKNTIMHTIWWLSAPITYRIVGYMVLGGNFVARKQALLDMGGFDQTIDFYGEDTDIARRLSVYGKVVFDMKFFIYSSSRRFAKEGLIKTNTTYALNFLWPILFHRPFTKKYSDVRKVSTSQTEN